MSENNKLNGMLNLTMEKIREMVDVETIIGDPITTPDGATVIPVSRVSYGFGSGGSDIPSKSTPPQGLFGGGSGAGVSIMPVGFLIMSNGNFKFLQIEPYISPVDRALEKVPDIVDKISAFLNKNKSGKADEQEPEESAGTSSEE